VHIAVSTDTIATTAATTAFSTTASANAHCSCALALHLRLLMLITSELIASLLLFAATTAACWVLLVAQITEAMLDECNDPAVLGKGSFGVVVARQITFASTASR
jgi:hypothetical protein